MTTAEEKLDSIEIWDGVFVHSHSARQAMIEFARLHVKAALKEASEKASTTYSEEPLLGEVYNINKDSILNAYPLENIK